MDVGPLKHLIPRGSLIIIQTEGWNSFSQSGLFQEQPVSAEEEEAELQEQEAAAGVNSVWMLQA